eukprot:766448-Hanusia_phi.AAC.4
MEMITRGGWFDPDVFLLCRTPRPLISAAVLPEGSHEPDLRDSRRASSAARRSDFQVLGQSQEAVKGFLRLFAVPGQWEEIICG